jgi:hypothetical protein
MADHSDIVGGSTAKRVINCPGSVALVRKMPPRPSSEYADTGTLLHNVIADILDRNTRPDDHLGQTYKSITLTPALRDDKLLPALRALDEIDPNKEIEYVVETIVGFGDLLPGVFGSADFIGRKGNRAIMLDWKFGDGVMVEVEENPQLLFYTAAAMRTPEAAWAFEGVEEIECIIVQPPHVKRWVTTPARVQLFERELFAAVKEAQRPDARLEAGDHCRWCAAKPICPIMTGAAERALHRSLKDLDAEQIGVFLTQAGLLEQWITDLRATAHTMLEQMIPVPGWKLVPKRATRQWVNEDRALEALAGLGVAKEELMETTMLSPAKAEKVLKKHKLALPGDVVVAISSGNTLAPESDPRPAVLQIGERLRATLGKL